MKIEFNKEDIEKIRRIARQEISRFITEATRNFNKKVQEEEIKEFH